MATLSVGGTTVFDGSATQGLTTATTFPAGHIIKTSSVFSGSTSFSIADTGTSGTFYDTGVETSLTPANGNKIMIIAMATMGNSGGNGEGQWRVQRKIGSGSWGHPTAIATQSDGETISQVGSWYDSLDVSITITQNSSWLDEPGTALECFYRIEIMRWDAITYMNRPSTTSNGERASGITSITLMEVQQ